MDIKNLFNLKIMKKDSLLKSNDKRVWWEYLFLLPGLFLSLFLILYTNKKDMIKVGIIVLVIYVAFAILAMLLSKRSKITNIVWFILTNGAMIEIGQIVNEAFTIGNRNANTIIASIMFVFFIPTVLFIITGKFKVSTYIGSAINFALALINIFVVRFRTYNLYPADIKSIGTALSVADGYKVHLETYQYIGGAMYAILICMSFLFRDVKFNNKFIFRGVASGLLVAVIIAHAFTFEVVTLYTLYNLSPELNGMYANFYYLGVQDFVNRLEPDGYSEKVIKELESQYPGYSEEELAEVRSRDDLPTVIVIMNESWADFRVIGDNFNTNIPVSPYYDSLNENIIKGYALSSQNGAGTSFCEYEFLTGNNSHFLTPGLTPYQYFINVPTYSLAEVFNEFGYRTVAGHPMADYNWSRNTAWPNLGFDDSLFYDDFDFSEVVRLYYMTDKDFYRNIINFYEENNDQPLFYFGVSIQNHGAYDYLEPDPVYQEIVGLEGYSQPYPFASEYLNRAHLTDSALEYLISYFEGVDEPVVIMMYGDHYPAVETSFLAEVNGGPFETLEDEEEMYSVPFFLWANYDIEEQDVQITNFSNLPNFLFEVTGLPCPAYTSFLTELAEVIPAMNVSGYYSNASGCYVEYDSDAMTDEEIYWLTQYRYLQYNSIYGSRSEVFFPTEE